MNKQQTAIISLLTCTAGCTPLNATHGDAATDKARPADFCDKPGREDHPHCQGESEPPADDGDTGGETGTTDTGGETGTAHTGLFAYGLYTYADHTSSFGLRTTDAAQTVLDPADWTSATSMPTLRCDGDLVFIWSSGWNQFAMTRDGVEIPLDTTDGFMDLYNNYTNTNPERKFAFDGGDQVVLLTQVTDYWDYDPYYDGAYLEFYDQASGAYEGAIPAFGVGMIRDAVRLDNSLFVLRDGGDNTYAYDVMEYNMDSGALLSQWDVVESDGAIWTYLGADDTHVFVGSEKGVESIERGSGSTAMVRALAADEEFVGFDSRGFWIGREEATDTGYDDAGEWTWNYVWGYEHVAYSGLPDASFSSHNRWLKDLEMGTDGAVWAVAHEFDWVVTETSGYSHYIDPSTVQLDVVGNPLRHDLLATGEVLATGDFCF